MSYGFIRRNEKKNSGITLKFGIEIEVPPTLLKKRKNTCNNRGSATHTTSDFIKTIYM